MLPVPINSPSSPHLLLLTVPLPFTPPHTYSSSWSPVSPTPQLNALVTSLSHSVTTVIDAVRTWQQGAQAAMVLP